MSQTGIELSPLKRTRREKILEVSERLFSQQGFRATTMEGVATEVGMSKVTVYGYFRDKDCLFQAVASRLATRIKQVVADALNAEGNLPDRLISALVAKHTIVFELVRRSEFSRELFDAKNQFAVADFKAIDNEIEKLLADAIAKDGAARAQSNSIARLLFGASTGIANHSRDVSDMTNQIEQLVRGLLPSG